MTLLVGIRCTDGVVVAADSAVTFGNSQFHTVSDSVCKIQVIDKRLILAGTGQVGLGQRFAEVAQQLWNDPNAKQASPVQIGKAVCTNVFNDFASTGAPKGAFGALLAFPAKGRAELCEFAVQDLQPELKTDGMWYASMGSGQLLADPYLRLIRSVFWQDGPPNLVSGKFAATWVLRHAIDGAPAGLGDPITMAVLEKVNGNFEARMLSADELREHHDSVAAATDHFRGFEKLLRGGGGNVPTIPTPGPGK
jgi:hypothetical protein